MMMEVTVSDFVMFEKDDLVRVITGPFASFIGVVEEVDEVRARLKVALQVFGRVTSVELEYGQVESKVWPTRRCADVS
jgi:transcriptional antiterminator NusG